MAQPTILVVAPSAYSLGGVQTWLSYLLPGLQAKNWRVVLGLTSGKFHNAEAYLETHPYANAVSIESATGSKQGRVDSIVKIIKKVNPDIVLVVNIVDVYQAINRLKIKFNSRVKVVATLHGIHQGYISDFKNYADTLDAVVCTNRLAQRLVVEKTTIPESRVMYAPYGVQSNRGVIDQESSSDQLMTIAYVGRFEEDQKRISDLLLIFNKLKETGSKYRFLLAGDGPDVEVVKNWVDSNSESAQARYLGVLDPEQLTEEVYRVSDVMLLTSYWETGPIVAWEAMNNGVILVSSKYIGHEEEGSLKHQQNCMLFDIGDIDSAVSCVTQLNDLDLRNEIKRDAMQLVIENYSCRASVDKWELCLSQILERDIQVPENLLDGVQDTGRLTSLFGSVMGEQLRKLLKIKFSHHSPGGEWPHSYGPNTTNLVEYISNSAK